MKEEQQIETNKGFQMKFPCRWDVYYEVKKEKKSFFGIYLCHSGGARFITHRTNSRKACNVAKLLQEAYQEDYEDAKD
ncbi:hypothetical protein PP175_26170 (plasmid) [Aneurinibacillus sp. Ricciae_BoGa-3]|uniref:hypothetical protein n=1 Tax=Aneurinibacillus sp. Ricciae_BoGa-3 TaxID=3022697 RepID=UPI00234122FD|nr:hypothetical protein [Aneurinibacillus sp. Ricciae_BoGa-3]WCK57554.1 hypothetical protein PP175_26170 [Aneurinibacillus sp. Ricciae_BoGa-3]